MIGNNTSTTNDSLYDFFDFPDSAQQKFLSPQNLNNSESTSSSNNTTPSYQMNPNITTNSYEVSSPNTSIDSNPLSPMDMDFLNLILRI